ncbi:MAG: WbuC family cupin fold metalloprotein [Granulosicoccaceae bacterium]
MTKKIDQALIDQLIQQATESPRLRSNVNFHTEMDDPVQRLLISLKRGTYVRPHHHPKAGKWELLLAVHGEMALVLFDEHGTVIDKMLLSPGETVLGAEMPPATWHTVYPITEDAVFLELKAGPYTPAEPSDFATWAPQEGEAPVDGFLAWVAGAQIGEKYAT